jgi:hypothetical protein
MVLQLAVAVVQTSKVRTLVLVALSQRGEGLELVPQTIQLTIVVVLVVVEFILVQIRDFP